MCVSQSFTIGILHPYYVSLKQVSHTGCSHPNSSELTQCKSSTLNGFHRENRACGTFFWNSWGSSFGRSRALSQTQEAENKLPPQYSTMLSVKWFSVHLFWFLQVWSKCFFPLSHYKKLTILSIQLNLLSCRSFLEIVWIVLAACFPSEHAWLFQFRLRHTIIVRRYLEKILLFRINFHTVGFTLCKKYFCVSQGIWLKKEIMKQKYKILPRTSLSLILNAVNEGLSVGSQAQHSSISSYLSNRK